MITVGRSLQPVYLTHEHDKGQALITLLVVAFISFSLGNVAESGQMGSFSCLTCIQVGTKF